MYWFALLSLASTGLASLEKRWTESQANCNTFHADITAEAQNVVLSSVLGGPPPNEQAWIGATVESLMTGSPVASQIAQAPKQNVSGTYSLWFEYCAPKSGEPKGVFETLHGVVGNAGYWNAQIDGKTDNSFAESAAAAGWATLSYDRLGIGRSAHPDGIDIIQATYESAQSVTIANMLRAGHFANIPAFSTVVGIGHSYGSAMLVLDSVSAPDVFNASVLTGFSGNATSGPLGIPGFASQIANVAYPDRFGSLGNEYLSTPDVSTDQKEFFHYPNYTQSALDLFTSSKGEYTIGQINSIPGGVPDRPEPYTKPTLIVTGANDAPFCAANCYDTSLGPNMTQVDTSRALFADVADSDFAIQIVPDTGHGLNFHTTAYAAYQDILAWVESHV